jgi:hypothetical protein
MGGGQKVAGDYFLLASVMQLRLALALNSLVLGAIGGSFRVGPFRLNCPFCPVFCHVDGAREQ